jgi:hypothetical protein
MAAKVLGASVAHIETIDSPYYGTLVRVSAYTNADASDVRREHLVALRGPNERLQ